MKDSMLANPALHDVLRISSEPYLYFTDKEIHNLLTEDPTHYYQFVSDALHNISAGNMSLTLPAKQIFEDKESSGDFRVMPCVTEMNDKVTKTIKIVGTNTIQSLIPDQITVGKAFALHPEENFISHVFEACLLSSARTGLCAALAVTFLADTPKKITILGAGRVGYYSAYYLCSVCNIDQIFFYDPGAVSASNCCLALNQLFTNTRFQAITTPFQEESDTIILATTSNTPICKPHDSKASLVISLGADCDSQHELDPTWQQHADIFVDTLDSFRYGDLKQWSEEGSLQQGMVTDIMALMQRKKESLSGGRRIFISTGSALFDNLTIAYILNRIAQ